MQKKIIKERILFGLFTFVVALATVATAQNDSFGEPPLPNQARVGAAMKMAHLSPTRGFARANKFRTMVTQVAHITNHGGWPLSLNVGADKGDKIVVDVKCDHAFRGWCFVGPPRLNDGSSFTLVKDANNHQQWEVLSPTTGDQFVNADYWWFGLSVHYEITIISIEANNL